MFKPTVEDFEYDGGVVRPGETKKIRYPVSETYLGDDIRIPVTIANGDDPGPTVFLTAATHGDELNGVEVVREVLDEWDHSNIHGTIVGIPVMNVPGFITQQRYLPIYDRDLNRSFPGNPDSTGAKRIAHRIYSNFIEPCDFGLDFHTSTRGRTNMFHVRADMTDEDVARLARSFGSNLIISSEGNDGMLRYEALEDDIQTITIEMGQAHRFERDLIDKALDGIKSVFAEFDMFRARAVKNPIWRTTIDSWDERTWLRADKGGMVEMHFDQGDVIYEGETICSITSPFKKDTMTIEAPYDGLLVGVLENPVVYPGNPLCHFVKLDAKTLAVIEKERGIDPDRKD